MKCPICGKEIDEASKYCLGCGKKVPRCPSCNKVLGRTERFCTYDGTRIPDDIMAVFETEVKEEPKVSSEPDTNENVNNQPAAAVYATPNQSTAQRVPKRKFPTWAIAVIAVFAVLNIALFFVVIRNVAGSSGSDTKSYAKSDEKETKSKKSKSKKSKQKDTEESAEEADDEVMASLDPNAEQSMENQVPSYETPDATAMVPATLPPQTAVQAPPPTTIVYYYEDYGDVLDYFIYNSDSIYFSDADLEGFDAEMCRLARNGIYARMGRKFKDQGLTDFFSQYYWYNPTIEADRFSDSWLNACQLHNRDLIVAYERRHGFN